MPDAVGHEVSGSTRIDVVVPIYNKLPFISSGVGSVADAVQVHKAAALWLVDHGSTDGSYELLLARFGDRATVMRVSGGTISSVRNLGAQQGEAPLLSFMDCDCVVPSDYFTRLESAFADHGVEATGCKVMMPSDARWLAIVWNTMNDDGGRSGETWINSANFAVRRAAFDRVGGFNEALVTGEDAEICSRIRKTGGRIRQDDRLQAVHLDNPKTIGAFYRKERWRGLGMFGTVSRGSLDKPVTMTIAHLVAIVGALLMAVWAPYGIAFRVTLALALVFAVPVVTVLYRRSRSVRPFSLFRGILLYQLYYLARINALLLIVLSKARARRRRPGGEAAYAEE